MTSAIVILNHNTAELARECVLAAKDCPYDYIIIVDNASSDSSREVLGELAGGRITFLKTDNRGYSAGNNIGARYAADVLKADVIFISNPDVRCPADTMKAVLSKFAANPVPGIVTGVVWDALVKDGPKVYKYFAYKVPSYWDMLFDCFPVSFVFRFRVLRNTIYYYAKDVHEKGCIQSECVSGCFFAISAQAYKATGGFDEGTFLYGEERILGFSLREKGYKVLVIDCPVYHYHDQQRVSTIRKRWTRYLLDRASAKLYLTKYLRVGWLKVKLYELARFINFAEWIVIDKIRGLL